MLALAAVFALSALQLAAAQPVPLPNLPDGLCVARARALRPFRRWIARARHCRGVPPSQSERARTRSYQPHCARVASTTRVLLCSRPRRAAF